MNQIALFEFLDGCPFMLRRGMDGETIVPEALVWRIYETVSEPTWIGGAVVADYRPGRFLIRAYLRLWRLLGKVTGMAQGVTQFCRRNGLRPWVATNDGICRMTRFSGNHFWPESAPAGCGN